MHSLQTERLLLREWSLNDSNDLYEYAKNDNIGLMAGWKPHENIMESRKIIKMFIDEDDTWAIELKANKKVIGSIGLHVVTNCNERMLGYVLNENYWGIGITVEASKAVIQYAFEILNLDKIFVTHLENNNQSRRVIEKLGFKFLETKEKPIAILEPGARA